MCSAVATGTLRQASLDFADGTGFVIERRQRWRIWRQRASGLGA